MHDKLTNNKDTNLVHDDNSKDVGNANACIPDPFENLMQGDEIWYKNHNPHHTARWLKASYIKRHSRNTFQVLIGNVPTTAHRGQLRIYKEGESFEKPNVLLRRQQRETPKLKDDEEFRGFSDEEVRSSKPRLDGFGELNKKRNVSLRRQQLEPEVDRGEPYSAPEDVRCRRKRRIVVDEALQDVEMSTDCVPRRSKRIRQANMDKDFVYMI